MSIHTPSQAPSKSFSVEAVRKDFPALDQEVFGQPLAFFDNAASAQKPRAVMDALERIYMRDYANIHRGVHTLSQRATEAYENARKRIATALNASEDREVIFVRGATEGINLVAQTFGRTKIGPGDNVVICVFEHHANIVPWQMICEEKGAELRVVPMDERGVIDLEAYGKLLDERTRIAALCHVSNSLGTINPVKEMIATAHAADIPVLLDSCQALPHFRVDVQDLDCDFLVFSGHKVYGPTGIGVLYGKADLLDNLPPYQGGGDMIRHVTFEKTTYKEIPARFEAGTPHIAGAVGLAAAFDYLDQFDRDAMEAHEHHVLTRATELLEDIEGLTILGTAPDKAAVISFVVDGIHPHDLGTLLDSRGIAVRTGHHCCEPLMKHLGVPGTTRASFAFYNTVEEAERLAKGIRGIQKMFA